MSVYKSLPGSNHFISLPSKITTTFSRDKLRYAFFALFAFFFTATISYLTTRNPIDTTATVAGFDPGNIINDYTMGNYNSMTESEIQKFLKSKNPCNDTNTKKATAYPEYSYHIKDGHFVCLADELFGDSTTIGKGDTAAHIIWQAAQDYKINPQVLIVLLQKEQGLITDTWPNSRQYRSATGYGCPDTAPCDSQYYGFKNQVRKAAALFRLVLDGNSSHYPVGKNYVPYNPSASCGGSWINIENLATSALYRYTPYQPNAAALRAGTGTGDSCSAYGNRNFYHYFTEWFGSTQTEAGIAHTQVIPNGTYTITSSLSNKNALGVSTKNNAEMVAKADADNQKWQITYDATDYTYAIINKKTGLALDLADAKAEDKHNVHTYTSNSTCAQKWHLVVNKDGSYTFLSSCSLMMALDINAASTAAGANVQVYTSNKTAAQKWNFIPVATIKNGTYEIVAGTNSKLALDISGGAEKAGNGTNVQTYTRNNTAAQKWQVAYNSTDGTYSITNPATALTLDVNAAKMSNSTNVQLYTDNKTCAQRWFITPASTKNSYIVTSACSHDFALDINAASTAAGANVQIYTSNGTAAQSWQFVATAASTGIIADGTYEIVAGTNSKLALDISGGAEKAGNGTNVQTYTRNNTAAQKWQITYNVVGDNYTIINPASKLALDVAGASTENGANIQVYTSNNTCAQRWKLTKDSADLFTFTSVCSSKVLDIKSASTISGANVWLYGSNGTVAQKWSLVQVKK